MTFLRKLKNNKKMFKNNKLYIAGDFETIIINNNHYVYAIGLQYELNGNLEYKDFFIENVNNNSSEEEIKLESLNLLKKFIYYLELKIEKNIKIYIYFHNLRSFDGYFIIKVINEYFYNREDRELLIKDNLIYKIRLGNINFLDTLNILNQSLNDISNQFFKEIKVDFDVTKIKLISDITKYFVEIKKYLIQDVNLLYKIVIELKNRFLTLFNIDITKNITISSISFHLYRTKYLKDEIEIEVVQNDKYNFIKQGYYGGLCNLNYTIASENSYCYDINSLYPYIMSTSEMPLGKSSWIVIEEEHQSNVDINKLFGFIECFIYVPEKLKIAPLPFRDLKKNLLQPTGYLKGVWFTEEIKNCLRLGCKLIKIYKVLHYKKKGIIFSEFVNELYEKRKNSTNNIDKTLYKNILNSLYGRFGIKINKTITNWKEDVDLFLLEHFTSHNLNSENNKIKIFKIDDVLYKKVINNEKVDEQLKNEIKKEYNKYEFKFSFSNTSPQISAAIAAYSRIKLVNDMYNHLLIENNKIYYYDTDSIFTNNPLSENMISTDEIGKYKLVYKFDKGIFLTAKNYCIIDIHKKKSIKFKTLKKNVKNKLEYKTFYNSLKKNSQLKISNVEYPITKNLTNLEIKSTSKDFNFEFESNKYIKLYDENNIFYKTKPVHIKLIYWLNKK